eukprot:snap_masked-scaffold_31-processed-gene-0.10-mRNA-1 protein AED:1.00 eAED:1.00 QI:0/0/0/0/1/1/2/0/91
MDEVGDVKIKLGCLKQQKSRRGCSFTPEKLRNYIVFSGSLGSLNFYISQEYFAQYSVLGFIIESTVSFLTDIEGTCILLLDPYKRTELGVK